MSKKIYILGALGYLGSQLCELYANSTDDVTAIDLSFYPERVAAITKLGIKYKQSDIFKLNHLIKDADIVYNLISITSVPQSKEQSNPQIDGEIYKIGIEGNRNVLSAIPKHCKLILTSTHCVFEKIKDGRMVYENDEPQPEIAYPLSKYQNERDLIESSNNFIIARLGSVFGNGASTMRWKIVANLFSKFAAIDGKINVFNKECIKPLIGLGDCCRGLKFLAESSCQREIFHLVSENKTVDEIAKLCKEVEPSVELNYVAEKELDGGVNLGYSLSNDKILSRGFEFQQTLKSEISNMINIWKNR